MFSIWPLGQGAVKIRSNQLYGLANLLNINNNSPDINVDTQKVP